MLPGKESRVKLYWVFLALFLVSVTMFVAAIIAGSIPLALGAIVITVVLFLTRGRFQDG